MVSLLSVHGDVCPCLPKDLRLVNDKIKTIKVGEVVDWFVGIVKDSRHCLKERETEGGRRMKG